MSNMTEPYARCFDCSWEGRVDPYREAQAHLEQHPEHHAYAVGLNPKDQA